MREDAAASGFKDHFSGSAVQYAAFRPLYPASLFAWLASQSPAHTLAWDCATGNGQAAIGLAEYFSRVIATDASAPQLAQAMPHPNIEYRVADAIHSSLPDRSVDLVTVAQAAHWLLLPAFYEEVCRVLKPGGLCVMWCYGVLTCEGDEVNQAVQAFCQHIAPWWPPERVHVENGYRDLPFPFAREMPPPFEMSVNWHLSELIGYLGSSSAATRYRAEQGEDPMSALEARLLPLWGSAPRRITWPLSVLAGRCVISAKPPCNASSR